MVIRSHLKNIFKSQNPSFPFMLRYMPRLNEKSSVFQSKTIFEVASIIIFLLFITVNSFSQSNGIFRIHFTDKNNSPYSLSNPEDFLSQKAIDRRTFHSIPYDLRDLPINPSYLDSVRQFSNIYIHARSKWMNSIVIETDSVTLDSVLALSIIEDVVRLKSKPGNISEEKLNVVQERRFISSSQNYYGAAYDQIHLHNGEWLHNAGYKGEDMLIAVMDAGFPGTNNENAFQHLYSENKIAGTYNFVRDESEVYANTHIHGTLVLSCMASVLEYEHVGTAPEANYFLFVTEDADTETPLEEDNWVEAAEYADSAGAAIINTSLGYTLYDDSTMSYSYLDMDGNTTFITRGADIAASKGILVVASAGNSGTNSWFYLGAPGDGDSVLTAGAVDKNGMYVEFSSKGPSSDGRVKPDFAAVGFSAALIWPGTGVTFGSGTSFSSPIGCGLAACLWQAHPEKSNMEIIDAIHRSSSLYSAPDSLMGYGIPDFYLAHLLLSDIEIQNYFLLLNVFPNPFDSEIYADVFAAYDEKIQLEIISVTGKIIYATEIPLVPSVKNRISLQRNFESMASGIYILRFHSQFTTKNVKVQYIRR